jgi:CRISPR-associated exonuclease Cas4
MLMKKIKIVNWRSIKEVEIDFEKLVILIGQNNHGKSNVLSALLFFFGKIPCTDFDYNKGVEETYVEVTFSDLDDHDKTQFQKYITADGLMCVRKECGLSMPPAYHGYCQIPQEDFLKEENIIS